MKSAQALGFSVVSSLGLCGAAATAAIPLPVAVYAGSSSSHVDTVNDSLSLIGAAATSADFHTQATASALDGVGAVIGTATATANALVRPGVPFNMVSSQSSVQATGLFPFDNSASASASITYTVEFAGPPSGGLPATVLVDVLAFGSVHATRGSSSFAWLSIAGPTVAILDEVSVDGTSFISTIGNASSNGVDGSLSENSVYSFRTNTNYTVSLRVSSASNASVLGATASNAGADPYFRLDASVPNPGLYSILVSAGVVNAPVPEPATLVLSAVGLFALTLSRQRSGRAGARQRRG